MTALNVMDRQLLSVLIDPIKAEFGVSDGAMGLLTGTAFAILHVTAGIPIGLAADRGTRRTIIAAGLALWSLLTFLTGFARSYVEIFAIRIGVGIGEAAGGAPSQSLLSDTFPVERRATALAVLTLGAPLGSILVFALGGWLADAYGWRVAFMIFGLPGLALALLIRTTVPEPKRGRFDGGDGGNGGPSASSADGPRGAADAGDDAAPIPFASTLRFVVAVPALRSVVLASGFHAVAMYAVLGWSVPFLTRVHGISTAEAGARLALASGLLTALGTFFGGALADRLARRDLRWLVWQPALALVFAWPCAAGFVFAPSAQAAMWLLAPVSLLAGSCFGPFYSVVQTLVAPRMRAVAAALVITANTVLGLGLGAPLVGWISDAGVERWGTASIRPALFAALCMFGVSAVLVALAARTLRRDLGAKDDWRARSA
ncbi:MAG: MFS transporter [Myxococcota bacterium]